MTLGSEKRAVQDTFLHYASQVGWKRLPREEAEHLRGGEDGTLFAAILADQLRLLNPGIVDQHAADELVHQLARVPPSLAGNLAAWEYLRGIRRVYVESEKRERDISFLDVNTPENNVFHVTDEWSFRPSPEAPAIRFDIVLLINGIPVIMIETKAATKEDAMKTALGDIRAYEAAGPQQMALVQIFSITNLVHFLYGATWNATKKTLYSWHDEAAGNYEALVKAFVDPARLLRVISDFIVFAQVDGELEKFVLRPHQMRAAAKVVTRAEDREKDRGLIWHTQGSGKTYTMITAARLLLQDPDFSNPTVVLVVDRTELEQQMAHNLQALGFAAVHVAGSKDHLEKLLSSDTRGLILTMIHKADRLSANLCTRKNVIVLIDEAHRSTEGTLGSYLMGALPNATFVGFTGTPIDRTAHGKGTFKIFGVQDENGYLDKYSIGDSIPDGTTLPLNYMLAPNELLVDRETLENEFLKVAELEGISDIEVLNKVLERAVTLRNIMKNGERVDAVAREVAQHFSENVEPMGYKAFLVAVDREACALYKDALDRYLPSDYSDVVISHGPEKGDHALKRFYYDELREQEIRRSFRNPKKLPKILIVTEKLLTGFDAPVLYAMYLDKPMRDHVLLQAIARVNRPYEDADERAKPAGLVVDFVGIFERLEDALAFDSKDVTGVITGLKDLQLRFAELMALGNERYLAVTRGLRDDKAVEAVIEHFRDADRRNDFQEFITELENLFEILSPDAFLRPYLENYEALMTMAALVRSAFSPGLDVDRSFLRKTAELVQQHTMSSMGKSAVAMYPLTEQTLEGLLVADAPDAVKVVNLVKLVHDRAASEKAAKPYLVSIGERAETLAQRFRDSQVSTQVALRQAAELGKEMEEVERGQQQSGLSVEAFAVRWYLQSQGFTEDRALAVAEAATAAFDTCPQWRARPDQERQVRMKLHGALRKSGETEGTGRYVDEILGSLRSARS